MKTAQNADSGSNSLGQMLALHCTREGVFTTGHFTPGHGSFPSFQAFEQALRQVYKEPVRHRSTAADQSKAM